MKKLLLRASLLMALAPMLVFASGCTDDEAAIQTRLDNYYTAVQNVDSKLAWEQATRADQKLSEPEDYFPTVNEEFRDTYRQVMKKGFDWEVEAIEVDGDRATAVVRIEQLDEGELIALLMGARKATGEDAEAIKKRLLEKVETGDIPRTTTRLEYVLHKENGEWRIFFDRKNRQKIRGAISEVRKLIEDDRLSDALAALEAARKMKFSGSEKTEVQKTLQLASEGVAEAEMQQRMRAPLTRAAHAKTEAEFDSAMSELEKIVEEVGDTAEGRMMQKQLEALRDARERIGRVRTAAKDIALKVEPLDAPDEKGKAVVFGTLQNRGERTFERVVIAIDFFDEEGNRLHQITKVPVDSDDSLAPGAKKKFEFEIPSVPPSWQGRLGVAVADVEY